MELFGLSPLLITGIVLVIGFICFVVGGTTPNYTDLDQKVWSLPHGKEHLAMIRDNSRAWRWARAWTVASTIVVLVGVSMLALLLEEAGGTILALVAWLITLLGAVCWIVGIAFQMGVEPQVAEKTAKKSAMQEWFSAMEAWSVIQKRSDCFEKRTIRKRCHLARADIRTRFTLYDCCRPVAK